MFNEKANKKYPLNIKRWVNVSAEGDITALDRIFSDDFSEMKDLNLMPRLKLVSNGLEFNMML